LTDLLALQANSKPENRTVPLLVDAFQYIRSCLSYLDTASFNCMRHGAVTMGHIIIIIIIIILYTVLFL
jgi:hypothetical protein